MSNLRIHFYLICYCRSINGYQYNLPWRKEHIEKFSGRGVVVVRNPYKAIISYWNFLKIGWPRVVQADEVKLRGYNTSEFRNFVFRGIYRWFELIDDWVQFGSDIYFVFYEDLKGNPVEEMRKLMGYLGLQVDEERLACLSRHLAGSFHRASQDTKDPFTEEHHLMISSVLQRVERLLRNQLGIKMPDYSYQM